MNIDEEPCDCDGLADDMMTPRHCCTGHVPGCTCHIDWDEVFGTQ